MSKPAGKCVFCGGRPLTKGHIWPDWIDSILGSTALGHIQEEGVFYTFTPRFPKTDFSLIGKHGSAGQRKPRNTCLTCNGGWMRHREELAMRPVTTLIRGERSLLSPLDQMATASLLCLISMRIEFLGTQRAVSPQERDYLRFNAIPSGSWHVWIARFDGPTPYEHWSRKYALRFDPKLNDRLDPEHCNAYVTTYVLGKFCVHLVYFAINGFGGPPPTLPPLTFSHPR
jgi:hypothetical protein